MENGVRIALRAPSQGPALRECPSVTGGKKLSSPRAETTSPQSSARSRGNIASIRTEKLGFSRKTWAWGADSNQG